MLDMGVWRHVKKETIHKTVDWLGVDGYLRRTIIMCTVPDLWQKVPAKSLAWISQITTPQWLMMSLSELWWQECSLKT